MTDTAVVDIKLIYIKLNIMKTLFITIIFSLLAAKTHDANEKKLLAPELYYTLPAEIDLINQCPEDNDTARDNLEIFLTAASFSSARNATGTNNLTTNQIVLLVDSTPSYKTVCQQLRTNSFFDPANDTIRTTVFYKVGNFYFVSKPITQDTMMYQGQEVVVTGPHFLTILDSNLEEVRTVTI